MTKIPEHIIGGFVYTFRWFRDRLEVFIDELSKVLAWVLGVTLCCLILLITSVFIIDYHYRKAHDIKGKLQQEIQQGIQ